MKFVLLIKVFLIVLILSSCGGLKLEKDWYIKQQKAQIHLFEPVNRKPAIIGRCFEKCFILQQVIKERFNHPIYTGSNFRNSNITKIDIRKDTVYLDTFTKSKIEQSSNSEKKSAWIKLEEKLPPLSEYIVNDTSLTTEYKIIDREYIVGIKKVGGYVIWKEVICKEDMSSEMKTAIQKRLYEIGYIKHLKKVISYEMLLDSFKSFQFENNLPYGHFDFESLKALANLPIEI